MLAIFGHISNLHQVKNKVNDILMDEAWWVQGFLIVAFYGLPLPISDSRFERVFHLFDNVLDSFENSWQIAVHFDVSFDIHGVHIAVNPQASVETDVVLVCGQMCFLL